LPDLPPPAIARLGIEGVSAYSPSITVLSLRRTTSAVTLILARAIALSISTLPSGRIVSGQTFFA
jgi:hypothetical protein